MEIQTQLY